MNRVSEEVKNPGDFKLGAYFQPFYDVEVIERAKDYVVYTLKNKETGKATIKLFESKKANYIFNIETGLMYSWGEKTSDDPGRFPTPNIADIECCGCCTGLKNDGVVCKFCYKSNTPTSGSYMTLEEFKHILDVYPKSLTQVALGADACLTCNPDIWKIMEYCRKNNIVPNITLANVLNEEIADKLAHYCGAVAISCYEDYDICFNSIEKLTSRGMKQVNIHLLLAEEYYERAKDVMKAVLEDPRLKKLNAVVCLGLKRKGRGGSFHRMSDEHFKEIVEFAINNHIGLGFDSCNSKRALDVLGDKVKDSVISCEASMESSYVSYKGYYYPCSFMEGEGEWKEGISLNDINSPEEFVEKIWNNPKTLKFKDKLMDTVNRNCHRCRECPYYEV